MSTINSKNVQVGTSSTAAQNFTLYQPATPDGTVRLGVGNSGATTGDVVTVTSAGVTVTGTLTATTLSGSLGAATATTLTVNSNNISAVNSLGFRNRIINGDMRIDQRNAGASISFPGGDGAYCLDRWRLQRQGAGTMTVQQVSSAPTGFVNALRFTVTGTSTPSASDFYTFGQVIEGFNAADLMWGTASAQTVTLSFWINSSVTGTYSASLYNIGGINTYPATFTVIAANTWEFKTIVIPGSTAGTWATTNAGSIYFRIDLGSGSNYSTATANAWNNSDFFRTNSSVNFISNASATLTVTGVQLEAGSVATPFERRDYGRELMMCQRYCPVVDGANSSATAYFATGLNAGANSFALYAFKVTTRVPPTGITVSSASHFGIYNGVSSFTASGVTFNSASYDGCFINFTGATLTAGTAVGAYFVSASGKIIFTGCEL